MNEPAHTTSQDDNEVARIVTDDSYLDRLARGREVPRDALSLVLGDWRNQACADESKAAADAYSFFCLRQALAYEPAKNRDAVNTVLITLFVLALLGYSTSIGLAFHSITWALLVSATSSLLCMVMIVLATVTTPRRK